MQLDFKSLIRRLPAIRGNSSLSASPAFMTVACQGNLTPGSLPFFCPKFFCLFSPFHLHSHPSVARCWQTITSVKFLLSNLKFEITHYKWHRTRPRVIGAVVDYDYDYEHEHEHEHEKIAPSLCPYALRPTLYALRLIAQLQLRFLSYTAWSIASTSLKFERPTKAWSINRRASASVCPKVRRI